MAGLMDMFRSRQQQQIVSPNNPNPGTEITNTTIPTQANPIAQAPGDKSPLDKFEKLWEKNTEEQQTPSTSFVPALNLDMGKLKESASKVDFVGQIPAELITKAMNGDASAFMEVINKSTQAGFAQALAGAAEITKQSLTSAQNSLNTQILPAAIRQQRINEAMLGANPAFSDPTVAPMLDVLKTQFGAKYPTASPEEIGQMAKEYLGAVAGKITGTSSNDGLSSRGTGVGGGKFSRQETDWGSFIEGVSS